MEKSPKRRNRLVLRNLTGKPKRRKSNLTTPQKQYRKSFQIVSAAGTKLIKKSYVKRMGLTNSLNEENGNYEPDLGSSYIDWIDLDSEYNEAGEPNTDQEETHIIQDKDLNAKIPSSIAEAELEIFWKINHDLFLSGILDFKYCCEFPALCARCKVIANDLYRCQECHGQMICIDCFRVFILIQI